MVCDHMTISSYTQEEEGMLYVLWGGRDQHQLSYDILKQWEETWLDGLVDKGADWETGQPGFEQQDGRRGLTPVSCPLAFTHDLWPVHTQTPRHRHILTHNMYVKCDFKQLRFTRSLFWKGCLCRLVSGSLIAAVVFLVSLRKIEYRKTSPPPPSLSLFWGFEVGGEFSIDSIRWSGPPGPLCYVRVLG